MPQLAIGPSTVPAPPASRPVRRATARQAATTAQRQAVHATPLAACPAPGRAAPAPGTPLYDAVLEQLLTALQGRGQARPTCKRLAVLVTGLLGGGQGTPSAVAHTVFGLGLGTVPQEPSVARRVARLLDDPQLDPARLLPDLAAAVLPTLLADVLRAHDHSIGTRAGHAAHHARWIGVRLIVDETTKADETHVLVVGLAYRGGVVPLGIATWAQTAPQPAGAYWAALGGLLWAVYQLLPAVLRDHVLVLADRGYGVPRLFDLLAALGWHGVVRVQGQTHVRLPDGRECPLRALVPQPGTYWGGVTAAAPDAPDQPLPVFKKAGWRALRVVGAWLPEHPEPWLLLTTLAASPARLQEYARRWAIERLFLAWKSHGWGLEATAVRDPHRLARLLTGYVVATWWLLAAAIPVAEGHLARLAARAARHAAPPPARPRQLPLPLFAPLRPWPAKRSLLTHGRLLFQRHDLRHSCPPLCWTFPDWEAPTWHLQCRQVLHGAAA